MAQKFDIRELANAWNTQSMDRILELYADDAEIIVPPDTEPYRGKQGVRENAEEVFGGIKDLNGDVAWSIQDGNKVAALVHVTGKHNGPMKVSDDLVIPKTGNDVRFMMGVFLELDDNGKIKRETDLADNISILQSVGALEGMMATGRERAAPKRGR